MTTRLYKEGNYTTNVLIILIMLCTIINKTAFTLFCKMIAIIIAIYIIIFIILTPPPPPPLPLPPPPPPSQYVPKRYCLIKLGPKRSY